MSFLRCRPVGVVGEVGVVGVVGVMEVVGVGRGDDRRTLISTCHTY